MVITSAVAAFLGSLVGLGGGMVLVPILLFVSANFAGFEWADTQAVVGISLVAMIFTALASLRAYMKIKTVDVKTGVLLLTGSIPGSIFGTWLNSVIDSSNFSIYFGSFIVLVLILLLIDKDKLSQIRKQKPTDRPREFYVKGELHTYYVSIPISFCISLFIGTLSGLFGIGGGMIAVPLMIILFGIPVQVAIATSMFMIFFTSLFSSISHAIVGNVEWAYVIYFIIGAMIGGTLGARVNQMLKSRTLELILKLLLTVIAVRLIIEGISN